MMNVRGCLCYSEPVFNNWCHGHWWEQRDNSASTTNRTRHRESSAGEGCSGNKIGREWLRKPPSEETQLVKKWHFEVGSAHILCVRSHAPAKDCPVVILKNMGSWKTKPLSMHVNPVLPVVTAGDKSVFLHAGILGRITLPWTSVSVVELEEE